MKKFLIFLTTTILLLVCVQSTYAKTTISVSYKRHAFNISNEKLNELTDMLYDEVLNDIENLVNDVVNKELIDSGFLTDLYYNELLPMLYADNDGDNVADLINELIDYINEYFYEDGPDLIADINENIREEILEWLEDNINIFSSGLTNFAMGILAPAVADFINIETPRLIKENLPSLTDVAIDEILVIVEDIISTDIPMLLASIVDNEIVFIADGLINKYFPRAFEFGIFSLDVKRDINDFIAIGIGGKAISLLNVFIPEVSLSAYIKVINEPKFDLGFMFTAQALFLPQMDDAVAINAGIFSSYRILPPLYIEGELMVGTLIADPFGGILPLVGGFRFGLSYEITNHVFVKVTFATHGFSELAVTALKYFITDKLEVGTFGLSVGCHF